MTSRPTFLWQVPLSPDSQFLVVDFSRNFPGLDLNLWKDNARPKSDMKRPYSTHLSYEKILARIWDMLDFSSTQIFHKRLLMDLKFSQRL